MCYLFKSIASQSDYNMKYTRNTLHYNAIHYLYTLCQYLFVSSSLDSEQFFAFSLCVIQAFARKLTITSIKLFTSSHSTLSFTYMLTALKGSPFKRASFVGNNVFYSEEHRDKNKI